VLELLLQQLRLQLRAPLIFFRINGRDLLPEFTAGILMYQTLSLQRAVVLLLQLPCPLLAALARAPSPRSAPARAASPAGRREREHQHEQHKQQYDHHRTCKRPVLSACRSCSRASASGYEGATTSSRCGVTCDTWESRARSLWAAATTSCAAESGETAPVVRTSLNVTVLKLL